MTTTPPPFGFSVRHHEERDPVRLPAGWVVELPHQFRPEDRYAVMDLTQPDVPAAFDEGVVVGPTGLEVAVAQHAVDGGIPGAQGGPCGSDGDRRAR